MRGEYNWSLVGPERFDTNLGGIFRDVCCGGLKLPLCLKFANILLETWNCNWCSPWLPVKISSLNSSYNFLWILHQVGFLTLKWPRETVKEELFFSKFKSKFPMKVSRSSWTYFVDLWRIIILKTLSTIMLMHILDFPTLKQHRYMYDGPSCIFNQIWMLTNNVVSMLVQCVFWVR